MSDIKIIDIEASGLHIDSYPVEIAVLISGQVKSWLIQPLENWQYWNETAENLHGISRDQLSQSGKPAITVAEELNALMYDTDGLLYSDAVEWDSDWIKTLYDAVGVIQQFHVLPIQDLFTENEYQLFLHKVEIISSEGMYRRHRAGEDVKIILKAMEDTLMV